MGQRLKTFADGSFLEYDQGNFDKWCVYLTDAHGSRRALRDVDYFSKLQRYNQRIRNGVIYEDFIKVYDMVGKVPNLAHMEQITELTRHYGGDAVPLDIIFSLLYMAMISEENREHTKLGKRIKRLGMYQMLALEMTPREAADYSRGMGWRDIDKLCKEYGF